MRADHTAANPEYARRDAIRLRRVAEIARLVYADHLCRRALALEAEPEDGRREGLRTLVNQCLLEVSEVERALVAPETASGRLEHLTRIVNEFNDSSSDWWMTIVSECRAARRTLIDRRQHMVADSIDDTGYEVRRAILYSSLALSTTLRKFGRNLATELARRSANEWAHRESETADRLAETLRCRCLALVRDVVFNEAPDESNCSLSEATRGWRVPELPDETLRLPLLSRSVIEVTERALPLPDETHERTVLRRLADLLESDVERRQSIGRQTRAAFAEYLERASAAAEQVLLEYLANVEVSLASQVRWFLNDAHSRATRAATTAEELRLRSAGTLALNSIGVWKLELISFRREAEAAGTFGRFPA